VNLYCEAVIATGNAEQLRSRIRECEQRYLGCSHGGGRLGFKTKLPLGPVPKPRPHYNFGPITEGKLDVKVHGA
jgi:hypothetical protein